jgi:hypothetical protein
MSKRASITEMNPIKLARETLGDENIMLDSSIVPASSSKYISPSQAYDEVLEDPYCRDNTSHKRKIRLISPEKSVELYRDMHGFSGEHFGLYQKTVDFSHVPKVQLNQMDKNRLYSLMVNLQLEHRYRALLKHQIGWNALFVLSRAHYEAIGFEPQEISLLLNTLQYVREMDLTNISSFSNVGRSNSRRKSMIHEKFEKDIGNTSLDSSVSIADEEVLVDSTSLKTDVDLPIPLSMYRNRQIYTRKKDKSREKYIDNPFYGQNMNEFMGGFKTIKVGHGDTRNKSRWISSLRSNLHARGYHHSKNIYTSYLRV